MSAGTITYLLDEAGRKASLLAGGDGLEMQHVSGELTAENIGVFAVSENGEATLSVTESSIPKFWSSGGISGWKTINFSDLQKFENLVSLAIEIRADQARITRENEEKLAREIDERLAREKREEAEHYENCEAYITALEADCSPALNRYGAWNTSELPGGHGMHGDGYRVPEGLKPRLAAIREPVEQKQQAEQAAREAEKAREAAERQEFLRAWVEVHGDNSQRARLAEELLPESEIMAALKNFAFSSLAQFITYDPILDKDVRSTCNSLCRCEDDGEDTCEISYSTVAAGAANASEYERLVAIREALPEGAAAQLQTHTGTCSDSDCDSDEGEGIVTRTSIRVTIPIGPFKFHRQFAV